MPQNAPRESPLIKLVDERIGRLSPIFRGLIIPAGQGTYFRELSLNPFESALTTVVNVMITQRNAALCGGEQQTFLSTLLRNVPIAISSKSYGYARFLTGPVELSKSRTGKVEITGLAKRGPSPVARKFEVSRISGNKIPGSDVTIGIQVWPIEYGDFPDAGGYGVVPYGAMGIYDGAGNFVQLTGS